VEAEAGSHCLRRDGADQPAAGQLGLQHPEAVRHLVEAFPDGQRSLQHLAVAAAAGK